MILRYSRIAMVLIGAVLAPAEATGQRTSRFGGGFTLGATPNLAEGFSSDQICPHRSAVAVAARATFALTKIVQLEAMGEVLQGPGISCVDGLIPPPPETGPYTLTLDYYDRRMTEPPTVLSMRIGGLLPKTGAVTLRPYVGMARFSGKGITTPQAGLSILGAGRGLRLLLEAEGWWYSVPKLHLEEQYFDGEFVSRSLTEHDVRNFTTVFRLGFTSAVGPNRR